MCGELVTLGSSELFIFIIWTQENEGKSHNL